MFYEPTDVPVAAKPFKATSWKSLKFISPNFQELRAIAEQLGMEKSGSTDDIVTEACNLGKFVSKYVDTIIITLGPLGLLMIRRANADDPLLKSPSKKTNVQVRHYETKPINKLVNVSGAGDCLTSGIISAMLMGKTERNCVAVGFAAANLALHSPSAVPKIFFEHKHNIWNSDANYVTLH